MPPGISAASSVDEAAQPHLDVARGFSPVAIASTLPMTIPASWAWRLITL